MVGRVFEPETGLNPFPTTPGAFDSTHNGFVDAFVTILSADFSSLVSSTFLGGDNADEAYGVALDSFDRPVVVGRTDGGTIPFPTTPGAFDSSYNGSADVFVTVFSPDGGVLVDSTFLGGVNQDLTGVFSGGVAVDSADSIYVAGRTASADFPTTEGAFQTGPVVSDGGFLVKFAPVSVSPWRM